MKLVFFASMSAFASSSTHRSSWSCPPAALWRGVHPHCAKERATRKRHTNGGGMLVSPQSEPQSLNCTAVSGEKQGSDICAHLVRDGRIRSELEQGGRGALVLVIDGDEQRSLAALQTVFETQRGRMSRFRCVIRPFHASTHQGAYVCSIRPSRYMYAQRVQRIITRRCLRVAVCPSLHQVADTVRVSVLGRDVDGAHAVAFALRRCHDLPIASVITQRRTGRGEHRSQNTTSSTTVESISGLPLLLSARRLSSSPRGRRRRRGAPSARRSTRGSPPCAGR